MPRTRAYMMFGIPGETEKGMHDSVDFAIHWMAFAKRPSEDFRIRFHNPDFNEEDLRRIQDECHRRFYARPGVMAREVLRLRSWTDLKAKVRVGTSILLKRINR